MVFVQETGRENPEREEREGVEKIKTLRLLLVFGHIFFCQIFHVKLSNCLFLDTQVSLEPTHVRNIITLLNPL